MRSELLVDVLVEPERHLRPPDEVRLFHHEVYRFLLRRRQRPFLEHRTAGADEIEESSGVDVLLEERAIRRIAVDVPLLDVDVAFLQKTSGVAARRSRRFPVEERLRHSRILTRNGEVDVPVDYEESGADELSMVAPAVSCRRE